MNINDLVREAHAAANTKGFWDRDDKNAVECLCLIHSEVSEALEELRNGRAPEDVFYEYDGKPSGFQYELADIVIRVADLCGAWRIDLEKAIAEKMRYNETRPQKHGRAF